MVAQAISSSESSSSTARPPKARPKGSSEVSLLERDFEPSSGDLDSEMDSWSDNAKLGCWLGFWVEIRSLC